MAEAAKEQSWPQKSWLMQSIKKENTFKLIPNLELNDGELDITKGLKKDGWIIINTDKKPEEMKLPTQFKVATINATQIAIKHQLGTLAAPIVNTGIVGAVVKVLRLASLESVVQAVKEDVPIKPEANAAAAQDAYELVIFNS